MGVQRKNGGIIPAVFQSMPRARRYCSTTYSCSWRSSSSFLRIFKSSLIAFTSKFADFASSNTSLMSIWRAFRSSSKRSIRSIDSVYIFDVFTHFFLSFQSFFQKPSIFQASKALKSILLMWGIWFLFCTTSKHGKVFAPYVQRVRHTSSRYLSCIFQECSFSPHALSLFVNFKKSKHFLKKSKKGVDWCF